MPNNDIYTEHTHASYLPEDLENALIVQIECYVRVLKVCLGLQLRRGEYRRSGPLVYYHHSQGQTLGATHTVLSSLNT